MKFDRKTVVFYWTVLKDSIVKFIDDDVQAHAAALSFYIIFSLPSMLLIVLWITAQIYSEDALLTAILIAVGKYFIAVIIGNSDIANVYDAAGSLLVIMLWIYYTAAIFLFGAVFTYSRAKMLNRLDAS